MPERKDDPVDLHSGAPMSAPARWCDDPKFAWTMAANGWCAITGLCGFQLLTAIGWSFGVWLLLTLAAVAFAGFCVQARWALRGRS